MTSIASQEKIRKKKGSSFYTRPPEGKEYYTAECKEYYTAECKEYYTAECNNSCSTNHISVENK